MRTTCWLAAVAGCSPGAPDYVPPEAADLSYGIGWVVRVEDDACGFEDDVIEGGIGGAVQVEDAYRTVALETTLVTYDCSETTQGPVAPGETLPIAAQIGEVVRIQTEAGEVLSAWELLFGDGGTVVIQ
jgi:hypothetical protein